MTFLSGNYSLKQCTYRLELTRFLRMLCPLWWKNKHIYIEKLPYIFLYYIFSFFSELINTQLLLLELTQAWLRKTLIIFQSTDHSKRRNEKQKMCQVCRTWCQPPLCSSADCSSQAPGCLSSTFSSVYLWVVSTGTLIWSWISGIL